MGLETEFGLQFTSKDSRTSSDVPKAEELDKLIGKGDLEKGQSKPSRNGLTLCRPTKTKLTLAEIMQFCCCTAPSTATAATFSTVATLVSLGIINVDDLPDPWSQTIKFGSIALAGAVDLSAIASWCITCCSFPRLSVQALWSRRSNNHSYLPIPEPVEHGDRASTPSSLQYNPEDDFKKLQDLVIEKTDDKEKAKAIINFFKRKLIELIKHTALEQTDASQSVLLHVDGKDIWFQAPHGTSKFDEVDSYLQKFNSVTVLLWFDNICANQQKTGQYQQLTKILDDMKNLIKYGRGISCFVEPYSNNFLEWVNNTFKSIEPDHGVIHWNKSTLDKIARTMVTEPLESLDQAVVQDIEYVHVPHNTFSSRL